MRVLFSIAGAVLLTFGVSVNPTRAESEPRESRAAARQPCEDLRFAVWTELGLEHPESLASLAETRKVEQVFARSLEKVGFERVQKREDASLILRAILQESKLGVDAVTGAVSLEATPELDRDFAFALEEGSLDLTNRVGIIVAVEIDTDDGVVDASEIEPMTDQTAQYIWRTASPVLYSLCRWKEGVIEDGLTIEKLRRRLVEEMTRIRLESRQRKQLDLEVEE